MSLIRSFFCQSILLLFVVQTLNFSINSIEFYNASSKSDISFDDLDYVDSMIEFVLEDVMGFSKHTFDDHAYNNSIAKIQQNVFHLDLRTMQYPKLLSDLQGNDLKHSGMVISNEDAICLYYVEVLPKPPQLSA